MQKTASSFIVYGLIALIIVAGGSVFTFKLCQRRAVTRAQQQLNRGFGALAAETIEPYHDKLARTEEGCRLLAQIYSLAHRADSLELTGENCLDHGVQTVPVILALANAQILAGHDDQALQILASTAQRFDKVPDLYYQMAQIFRRIKHDNDAVLAYERAADRAKGDHQLEMEALQYFMSLDRWADAKMMADRLKSVQTDNPEVKLVIARVYLKNGDKSGAKSEAAQAQAMVAKFMAKNPGLQESLQKKYPDIYKIL